MRYRLNYRLSLLLLILTTGSLIYFFSLPNPLFHNPYCTVLEDRHGQLLSASIASDGQWRFPEVPVLNEKFEKAIVAYEDKRFWDHPGVDPLAIARAIRENVRNGRIMTGGSTLTMQVVRLSRENPSRTFFEKLIEIVLATRVEWRYSKREILGLYASHAPYGGNVVGIEAACWRYFGRGSQDLSWSEAALLAVLPNNPSLIHLARNRDRLREKRDLLLKKLLSLGALDDLSLQLALSEPIPERPLPLPRFASHLLSRMIQEGYSQKVLVSTIDVGLQERVERAVEEHSERLKANQIFNAAALVLDVKTGMALAYVGNAKSGSDHQEDVDVIRSPRSTGSILKPFLYAALVEEGKILPGTLIPDVPTLIGGFSPKNFSRQYDGAVPANQALIRSLNVPAVHELREYRYEKFYDLLKILGMTTLSQPPDHYGLSLVLGGAEGTLWDITGMYASGARVLNNYFERPGKSKYDRSDLHPPVFAPSENEQNPVLEVSSPLRAASLWTTYETLLDLYRPGEETGWQHFSSTKPIAWKTGTSFGFRDGWAIGVNPDFAVGVWVGNADGEGRPGLTGTEAAAPLLFNIFSLLPGQPWFQEPKSELVHVSVCRQSGQRASVLCDQIDTVDVPSPGLSTPACKFHQLVHLSLNGKYRVHADCAPLSQMKAIPWFVLPPIQEYYYKAKNLSYQPLPVFRSDCSNPASLASIDIIYPKANARIYLPVQLDGRNGLTLFEATHRSSKALVFWHLDGTYVGSTRGTHQLALTADKGTHILTLVDDSGETLQRSFQIISER